MTRLTPEQQASADLARTVLSDPNQRPEFDRMVKETDDREPVPDDFAVVDLVAAWQEAFRDAPEPIRAKVGALGFFTVIEMAEVAVRALGQHR